MKYTIFTEQEIRVKIDHFVNQLPSSKNVYICKSLNHYPLVNINELSAKIDKKLTPTNQNLKHQIKIPKSQKKIKILNSQISKTAIVLAPKNSMPKN